MMTSPLGSNHRTHLLICILDIHRRLAELEAEMAQATISTPFSKVVNDLSPTEVKVVQDHFARLRTVMLSWLQQLEIPLDIRRGSLRWTVQTGLIHVGVTIDDMGPKQLAGYGELDAAGRDLILKIQQDLERLTDRARGFLQQGLGRDLAQRLSRLDSSRAGLPSLSLLEKVISRWQLLEFRPWLDMVVSRLEDPRFEIAVFGRVSSGKSSLLNHVAGADALPVGVTPVTAVPTRMTYGKVPSAVVSFAESGPQTFGIEQVGEFASEENNPGNRKRVTNILVRIPSSRLRDGVVFVDTPGVGSLALEGSTESLAYLPRCDLGIVLIDAASTLDQDDLALLRSLYEAGVPATVLLSKADLLSQADRDRMVSYIQDQIQRQLGLDLAVRPVSIKGTDEALLDQWFEREILPLLSQHRSLAESSLCRKVAGLCEAVTAVLEMLIERRQHGSGGRSRINVEEANRLLEEADEAIRAAKERYQDWSADRMGFLERLNRDTARAVVEGDGHPDGSGMSLLGRVVAEALARRGRTAYESVNGLRETFARCLEGLRWVAPAAAATGVESVQDERVAGLPAPNLEPLQSASIPARPLWADLLPSLAARRISSDLGSQAGAGVRNLVEAYDRQLQGWVKAETERFIARYETQAVVFRELIRRLGTSEDNPSSGDLTQLGADLRELTQIESNGLAPDDAGARANETSGVGPTREERIERS